LKEGHFVDSEIFYTELENLIEQGKVKTFLTQAHDSIEFPKFSLNPNEALSIKALLTGYKDILIKRGRITVGVESH